MNVFIHKYKNVPFQQTNPLTDAIHSANKPVWKISQTKTHLSSTRTHNRTFISNARLAISINQFYLLLIRRFLFFINYLQLQMQRKFNMILVCFLLQWRYSSDMVTDIYIIDNPGVACPLYGYIWWWHLVYQLQTETNMQSKVDVYGSANDWEAMFINALQ